MTPISTVCQAVISHTQIDLVHHQSPNAILRDNIIKQIWPEKWTIHSGKEGLWDWGRSNAKGPRIRGSDIKEAAAAVKETRLDIDTAPSPIFQ
ncbi:hypothetical protein E2C01_011071 [Portunus trituberculatus]|uniref:Uncharacterized protein n=1 Tax=Portunus trituberculatus TaxID=210409 RepID=A0A5B7DA21_PORTR|nr:hypothetical protein [Portunus trituberculatus]